MNVTLKDVAERAGVSTSAVSRTYTEGASVSASTRKKVEAAAHELGYRPNVLASSLTTGRTKLVGLVASNFQNPIFLSIFDRFTHDLQDRGLRPLLVNLSGETDPQNSLQMLRQYSVDAVIVASSTLPVSFAKSFHDAGIPVVHSFGRHTARTEVDVVGIDNFAVGQLAAETLIDRGYQNIAMLAGPENATSTTDRLKGFQAACKAFPDVATEHAFAQAYSFDAGRILMTDLVQKSKAEAFFCGDDVLAIGALAAIQAAGKSVPNDIGLIGVNDMQMSDWGIINLTTISNPISEIVRHSVDLVESMLGGQNAAPKAHLHPSRLVERGTLRPKP